MRRTGVSMHTSTKRCGAAVENSEQLVVAPKQSSVTKQMHRNHLPNTTLKRRSLLGAR